MLSAPGRGQHRKQAPDEQALPCRALALQAPVQHIRHKVGDHEREDGHGGPILGHQVGSHTCMHACSRRHEAQGVVVVTV